MSVVAGALIGAGVAAASAGTTMVSNAKMNKRAVAHANDMWDKQGVRERENWHMQNAYNDPSAQMQRLKDAGLNPNLVYGNGADAKADAIKTSGAPTAPIRNQGFNPDLSAVAMNALQMKQIESNIARTNAETMAINSRTRGTDFQNSLNETIGIDKMTRKYDIATDILETQQSKTLAEYNAWQAGAFQGKATDDPSSPIAKATKAGYQRVEQQLENESKLGDLRGYETTIKAFQAELTKQGLPPDSPWYAKIIGDLLMKTLGIDSLKNIGKGANFLLNSD